MADKIPLVLDSGQVRQSAAGDVIVCPSIKDSALTSTRVVFSGASGLLSDSEALAFDGTTLTQYKRNIAYPSFATTEGQWDSVVQFGIYLSPTGDDSTGLGTAASPWKSLGKADSWLSNKSIAGNTLVYIWLMDGVHTLASQIIWRHPDAARICIKGLNSYTKTLSSIQSSSGGTGAYSFILNLDTVTNITTDDYIYIPGYGLTGGTNPAYLAGIWPITDVDVDNNRITISSTLQGTTVPSGAVAGTVHIKKAILDCTVGGFNNQSILFVGNFVIKGTKGGWGYWGIYADMQATVQESLGSSIFITGFTYGIFSYSQTYLYSAAICDCSYGIVHQVNVLNIQYSSIVGNSTGVYLGGSLYSADSATVVGNSTNYNYTYDVIKVGPLTATSITDSGLTSSRVVFAGANGLLTDNANLTFDGTKIRLASATGIIEVHRFEYTNAVNSGSSLTWYAGTIQTGGIVHYLDSSIRGNTYFQTYVNSTLVETLRLRGYQVGVCVNDPSAVLHLKAGTTAAGTAPLKFNSGTSLTAPEAGAVEFTTDDLYFTITTGAVRKGFILNNGSNLTSGKIPVATTNGRLIDGPTNNSTNWNNGIVPIGSVMSWLKSYTNTPALPTGWVECNGQTLSDADSVYNGQTIPDLNGGNRFLRGNSTSGGVGGESTHTLTVDEIPARHHTVTATTSAGGDLTHYEPSAPNTVAATTQDTSDTGGSGAHENKPPYYDVVWIMRVK